MAKKKKTAVKKYRVRHRRQSGMGAIDTTNLIGTAVGALGAKLLNKVIPDTIDKKIVAGGKIAVGVLLPMVAKDGKTKNMLGAVANGFVAVGTIELVEELGVIEGLGRTDDETLAIALEGIEDVEFEDVTDRMGENVLGEDVLGMDDDLSVVNGNDLAVVNADDDEY